MKMDDHDPWTYRDPHRDLDTIMDDGSNTVGFMIHL